jgi:hypothetical protein
MLCNFIDENAVTGYFTTVEIVGTPPVSVGQVVGT